MTADLARFLSDKNKLKLDIIWGIMGKNNLDEIIKLIKNKTQRGEYYLLWPENIKANSYLILTLESFGYLIESTDIYSNHLYINNVETEKRNIIRWDEKEKQENKNYLNN